MATEGNPNNKSYEITNQAGVIRLVWVGKNVRHRIENYGEGPQVIYQKPEEVAQGIEKLYTDPQINEMISDNSVCYGFVGELTRKQRKELKKVLLMPNDNFPNPVDYLANALDVERGIIKKRLLIIDKHTPTPSLN